MKRNFTFTMAALALIVAMVLPRTALAQNRDTYTWVASEQGYSNGQDVSGNNVFSSDYVSCELAKGTSQNPPKYYYNNNTGSIGVRLYLGNTVTVSPLSGVQISRIEYTFCKQGTQEYADVSLEAGGGTYTSGGTSTGTSDPKVDYWEADVSSGDKPVVIRVVAPGKQRVLQQISVTYTSGTQTQWTVTYKANCLDTQQNDVVETYVSGSTVTVAENTFSYTNHVFDKWNTAANGSGTSYFPGNTFTINNNVTLFAQWIEMTSGWSEVLNPTVVNEAMGSGSGYCEWTQAFATTTYKGKTFKSDNYIQMTHSTSGNSKHSGIVTTASTGKAVKVQVNWNSLTNEGRTLNVYGRTTAYSGTEDLYDNQTQGTLLGTIVKGTSTELTINGTYTYIGLCSDQGAMYFDEIRILWDRLENQPAIAFGPASINLGNVVAGTALNTTFIVSQANLENGITLSTTQGELSTTAIAQGAEPTHVTLTHTPTGSGPYSVTVTATSGSTTASLTINATVLPSANVLTLHENKAAFVADNTQTSAIFNLQDVEVVGQSGNYLYLQDAQAGVLVYGAGTSGWQSGDKFTSGYLTGTYQSYNGITQIVDFTFVGANTTSGNALTCTAVNMSVDDFLNGTFTDYESRYLQFDNRNIANWALVGTNANLILYDLFNTQFAQKTAPNTNDAFTVKGLFIGHYSNGSLTKELVPLALTDISTTVQAAQPSVNPANGATTTYFTINPATNCKACYQIGNNETMTVITSTTVNLTGNATVTAYGIRDFYQNSATMTRTYTWPSDVCVVGFSVNGTVGSNTVSVSGSLEAAQTPAVNAIGDYAFVGWSTQASSTTTVTMPYTIPSGTSALTLYAVYAKAESHNYVRVTTPSEIEEGVYVITANNGSKDFTIKNAYCNYSSPQAYTLEDLNLTVSDNQLSGDGIDDITWNFAGDRSAMTVTSTANGSHYLYIYGNSNTGVRVGAASTPGTWNVSEDNNLNAVFHMMNSLNSRYLALYVADPTHDWRSYTNLSNGYPRLTLYKRIPVAGANSERYTRIFMNETAKGDITIVGPSVIPSGSTLNVPSEHTFTSNAVADFVIEDGGCFVVASGDAIKATVRKNIVGYGTDNTVRNGWYLLSSPVNAVNPNIETSGDENQVNGMLTGDNYDLYQFDQSEDQEWRNYEQGEFYFGPGNSVLYASQTDRTLTFKGTLVTSWTGQTLSYVEGKSFAGWNLIGNPFNHTAYLERAFYVINPEGRNEIILANRNSVEAMEGVFVIADEDGETMTFSTTAPQPEGGALSINAMRHLRPHR